MKFISIDIETYSDIDIKKGGMYKYVQSPNFEVLLFAYSIDGGYVKVVDLACGEMIPEEVVDVLFDSNVEKRAYNAVFEWYCLSKYFRTYLPIEQWVCTMHHGLYCGYPMGLSALGLALGLPSNKQKMGIGMALIRKFCIPRKPTSTDKRERVLPHHEPEKWALFKEYCRQDVVTEMEIKSYLEPFKIPKSEHEMWVIDIKINSYGVLVDMDLVQGAIYCSEIITNELMQEAQKISELENPKSVAQLSKWLEEETGEEIDNLRKGTVTTMIDNLADGKAKRMLEIRQELSKTSVKKYQAMNSAVCSDNRIRGLLQFYGANRTGRWAGRLVQVQNLPRNYMKSLDLARNLIKKKDIDMLKVIYGNIPDTLSQVIRTAFVSSTGKLVVSDFSAIEARVIAYLANEQWRLEVFATHGKIYEASASTMFNVPIEKIKKGNPEYALRQKGKVAELALGYQGSKGALIAMGALDMGLEEHELADIVQRWRSTNKRIVDLWYRYENAAITVITTGMAQSVPGCVFSLEYSDRLSFFTIELPSGRKLYYPNPHLKENSFGKNALYYFGVDQNTKKFGAIGTYGGKLVENVVQAIARDCLAEAIKNVDGCGFKIVMHIHDEIVVEGSNEDLDMLNDILGTPLKWAPGLILKGDGFVSDYYKKD